MRSTYRNIALAAGGALAVGVAAGLLRARTASKRERTIAQAMTVLLERGEVMRRLHDGVIQTAVGCESMHLEPNEDDARVVRWSCDTHPSDSGSLALMPAPNDRGTELHVSMRGQKYDVKEVLRRLKMLLETGELATGARQ